MKKSILLTIIAIIGFIPIFSQNPYQVNAKTENEKTEKKLTAEEKFVSDNFPFIHISDWQPGMEFMVEPDYLEVNNRLDLKPRKTSSYSDQPLQKDYEWKTFELISIKNSSNKSYFTFQCGEEKFIHEAPANLDDLRGFSTYSYIKEFVYLKDIDKAKELLLGKQLYLLTERWRKENGESGVFDYFQKFVPVTIVKIGLGQNEGPVKMIFKTEDEKEYFLNVRFSGTNTFIYEKVFGIDFTDAFTFENPRDSYPEISDEMWNMIQNCKVKIGMTETEAELAWGKPKEINVGIYGSSSQDQWLYGTNSYLYFENGKLSAIQN